MNSRNAFTLLELLLAMTVFAIGAAMVLPIAGGLLADRRLVRGGDQLRAELVRLRVHAMRQGKVMSLQADSGANVLQIVPVLSGSDAIESIDQTGSQSSLLAGADQTIGMGVGMDAATGSGWTIELPEGIAVTSIVTSPAGGASSVEAAALNSAVPGAGGSGAAGGVSGSLPTVYFYPTGQASNAIITLGRVGEDEGDNVRVQVRGLTGDVTIRE